MMPAPHARSPVGIDSLVYRSATVACPRLFQMGVRPAMLGLVGLAWASPVGEVAAQLPESPLRPPALAPAPGGLPPASLRGESTQAAAPLPLSPSLGASLLGAAPVRNLDSEVTAGDDSLPNQLRPRVKPESPASPLERGVVDFEDPADFLERSGASNGEANREIQPVAAFEVERETALELSPLEQRYAGWWREVLASASIPGQPLELQAMLRNTHLTHRVAMVREYWRLGEAIMAVQIHRETLDTWRQATTAQSQQPLVRTVVEMLQQQIEQASATIEAEQEHLGLWLQRGGVTITVRPVDAPFLGPYDTKLDQLQARGQWSTDLAVLAQRVNDMKQEIVDDSKVIDWAESEWERARGSGDLTRMAAMIQLRQTAYLLWLGRVTRYNDAIAQYAFRVAGPGLPLTQQLGMLLRQPLIDGRLVDLAAEPWQIPAASLAWGEGGRVAPVAYHQFSPGQFASAPLSPGQLSTNQLSTNQFSTNQFSAAPLATRPSMVDPRALPPQAGSWQPAQNR